MNYFFVTAFFGIAFSFICFFLTVWRMSSSLADLVNYFLFTLNNDTLEDQEKDVRKMMLRYNRYVQN